MDLTTTTQVYLRERAAASLQGPARVSLVKWRAISSSPARHRHAIFKHTLAEEVWRNSIIWGRGPPGHQVRLDVQGVPLNPDELKMYNGTSLELGPCVQQHADVQTL